jgi:Cupin-like domain
MGATIQPKISAQFLMERHGGDFAENFDRGCFTFSHFLADHPLFDVPALLEHARAYPRRIYYDAGSIRTDQRWDQTPPRPFTLAETIQRIDNAGAWVSMNDAQENPKYRQLLEPCLDEVRRLSGVDFRSKMRNAEMIVFLTSPNRITPYHIDRECNFLLQVRGSKTLYVFDGNDRSILPEEEIERFWTVDSNAAKYKERFQESAAAYRFRPGDGIHIPIGFPHWVKNDDNVSVSVSLNFQFIDSYRADKYRANYYLRRMGLRPNPPGHSKWRDWAKVLAYSRARRVCRIFGKKIA